MNVKIRKDDNSLTVLKVNQDVNEDLDFVRRDILNRLEINLHSGGGIVFFPGYCTFGGYAKETDPAATYFIRLTADSGETLDIPKGDFEIHTFTFGPRSDEAFFRNQEAVHEMLYGNVVTKFIKTLVRSIHFLKDTAISTYSRMRRRFKH